MYVWASTHGKMQSNQPKHPNHWQVDWISLIISLHCNVRLANLVSWHLYRCLLTHNPSRHCWFKCTPSRLRHYLTAGEPNGTMHPATPQNTSGVARATQEIVVCWVSMILPLVPNKLHPLMFLPAVWCIWVQLLCSRCKSKISEIRTKWT